MASVPVTLVGVAYTDKTGNPPTPITIVAEQYYTGVGVGGGPMPGGPPLGIWHDPGGYRPPYVDIGFPGNQPGIWGPGDPRPTNPISGIPGLPGYMSPLPPGTEQPQPGDPTTPLPPPSGSSGWPVQPITPPPYIVVQYPGIGPVIVAPPESSKTT